MGCVWRTCFVLALLGVAGCATWDVPVASGELKLPVPNAGSDAVVFETAFIRWSGEEAAATEELWKAVDEQFLPPSLRQELAANGLRAGILSDPIPESIRASLQETSDLLSVITDENASPGAEVLTKRERRTCPSGSREEIEVMPLRDEKRVVLCNDRGRVRAIPFDQPRGFYQLTVRSLGNGSARVELLPTVDFGTPRQRIIGGQNAFRLDVRRDRQVFESLAISPTLGPGKTLVLSGTPEKKGLGAYFFADRFESTEDRLLLLFRIVEAGRDDLFSPHRGRESLVSPTQY
jgi:hypothetical protein